jgi:hypothetical protein
MSRAYEAKPPMPHERGCYAPQEHCLPVAALIE